MINRIAGKSPFKALRPVLIGSLGLFLMAVSFQIDPTRAWGETLKVTAAADLMPVLPILARTFTKKTHITVRISYSSSGESSIAIRHHAPFDLFFSADSTFPEKLSKQGWVLKDSVQSYAQGILVLWVSQKVLPDGKTPEIKLSLLRDPKVQKIALANPRLAPYGHAAMQCLKSKKLWIPLHKKIVYGNTLAQVSQYLKTKTAEAGFLSNAQAMVLSQHARGSFTKLSPSCVPDLEQKMAIIKATSHLKASMAFENFILEKTSQDFLKAHGYR